MDHRPEGRRCCCPVACPSEEEGGGAGALHQPPAGGPRLVAEATDAGDPELAVAALLHDAIEDQQVPREAIADAFGEGVAALVEECTDDMSLAS